jgi:hypothetical protein
VGAEKNFLSIYRLRVLKNLRVTKDFGLKQFLGYTALVVVGLFTVNYWLTDKLEMREPLVGCWPVFDPIIGFCL